MFPCDVTHKGANSPRSTSGLGADAQERRRGGLRNTEGEGIMPSRGETAEGKDSGGGEPKKHSWRAGNTGGGQETQEVGRLTVSSGGLILEVLHEVVLRNRAACSFSGCPLQCARGSASLPACIKMEYLVLPAARWPMLDCKGGG